MRQLVPTHIIDNYKSASYKGALEAYSLFIDISGFTSLTEGLMQHGRIGAEILSKALNDIFSPNITTVDQWGGFITTFAGDSYTAIFPTSDLATLQRVIQAAFGIQDFFKNHTAVTTQYGTFKLSVKCGIGKGSVHWGIIKGNPNNIFYYKGEGIYSAAHAEAQAKPGEIIAHWSIVEAVQAQLEIEPVADTEYVRIVQQRFQQDIVPPPVPIINDDWQRMFVPDTVDSTLLGEFRQIGSVFISFEEPELPEQLDQFLHDVLTISNQFGGYFRHVDFGDKGPVIVVLFGAPLSYENNAQRTADFLLKLRQSDQNVRWRAGVTFGTAYTGFIGAEIRSDYAAIGDVMNLAARIMVTVNYGEIRVDSQAKQQMSDKRYQFQGMEVSKFKGKREAVATYLLQRQVAFSFDDMFTDPLVGRQAELQQVKAALSRIDSGMFAGLIYISGEAGIGKSRLAYELRQSNPQWMWMICQTDEMLRQPFNPFQYFLMNYFNQNPDQSETERKDAFKTRLKMLFGDLKSRGKNKPIAQWLVKELKRVQSVLGALIDLHWQDSLYERLDAELRFKNIQIAVKTLIRAESLLQPVVLLVEDAHWMDDSSLQIIRELTVNMKEYPIGILLTSRYHNDGTPYCINIGLNVSEQSFHLNRLSIHGVAEIIKNILNVPVSAQLVQFVGEKTSGNPLFVEQFTLNLREQGLLQQVNGHVSIAYHEKLDVPTTIEAVLISRLDRLANRVKTIVQTASVLGNEFDVRILAQMLKQEMQVLEYIQQAEKAMIWTELARLRYLFRHVLMREAAYGMQLHSRLQELHLVAADGIKSLYAHDVSEHYAELAYHYGKGGDKVQTRAYAKLAGDAAAARYANREALDYYAEALYLTDVDDYAARFDLLLLLEGVYEFVAERAYQDTVLQEAETLLENLTHDHVYRLALRRANYFRLVSQFDEARKYAQQAVLLAGDDIAKKARALQNQGYIFVDSTDYDTATEMLQQAIQLAKPLDELRLIADIQINLTRVYMHLGRYEEGITQVEEALKRFTMLNDQRGIGTALVNRGSIALQLGYYDEARKYMSRATSILQDIGDRYRASVGTGNLASIQIMLGDYLLGRAALHEVIELQKELNNRYVLLHQLGNLGAVEMFLGDHESALQYLHEAITLATEPHSEYPERASHAWSTVAMVHFHQKQYAKALEETQKAHQIAEDSKHLPYVTLALTIKGLILLATSDWRAAEETFQETYRLQMEMQEQQLILETRCGLARALAEQGRIEAALEHVNQVYDDLDESVWSGSNDPAGIFLNSSAVLRMADDPRANDLIKTGYDLLMKRVKSVNDETYQKMMLSNMPSHQIMVAMYNEIQHRQE